ncbi:PH domain-containing protein [Coniochaeta sp. 2T2.1]|nr:PH domain-containing protein [Coniochaeta sp. 2T2.1]
MSQFSATHKDYRSPTPTSSPPADVQTHAQAAQNQVPTGDTAYRNSTEPFPEPPQEYSLPPESDQFSPAPAEYTRSPPTAGESPSASPTGRARSVSRPLSMVQTYQPTLMDVNEDTIPELQPIFTFLNSHQNKLYQEGYFLKLDDQDTRGKPNPDRTWTECFAQLVGTVLSLWDAAELDAAGEEGEVLPKFINLTDASIKMIESLPTRSNDEQPLQNILSISTAGRNRYLLHFNSHHSLIQWTAGIRLAMYEHSTLQEAYTGALIAGKGKTLNNINLIMDRTKFKTEEWVRVRFGAGVPWRRCWCVISPPDEKEYLKLQKEMKKRSPYDRSHPPVLKGDIKFYDSKKEAEKKKKARPIASITEAYSAYAIYPQSRALIDGSTLLKVEGSITIHSDPPSATEGFVFIMPETRPAVSGFEMLLRFLFPTWDTFALYGRPGRLVASVLDPRSLMFAMPKHKRYGYLEILDVTGLILTEGNASWTERDWRKQLKDLTGKRMTAMEDGTKTHGRSGSRSSKRLSFGPTPGPPRARVGFADDAASIRSSRSMSLGQPGPRTDSAPPDPNRERAPSAMAGSALKHTRNSSDTQVVSGTNFDLGGPPQGYGRSSPPPGRIGFSSDLASTPERVSSDDEHPTGSMPRPQGVQTIQEGLVPVNTPPAFAHGAGSKPSQKPYHSPEMRRATSRLSSTTLSQLAKAGGLTPEAFRDRDDPMARAGENSGGLPYGHSDPSGPPVQPQTYANNEEMHANHYGSHEALSPVTNLQSGPPRSSPGLPPPDMGLQQQRSRSPMAGPPGGYRPGPNAARPPPNNYRGPGGMGPPPAGYPGQGPPMVPPPQNRGPPPHMMGRGGPPPQGYGNYPPRDPRMGPPGPPGPGPPGGYQNYRGPPPPGGRRTPPPGARRGPPPNIQTSPPINRKPLPQRTTSLQRRDESVPSSPSSRGSLRDRILEAPIEYAPAHSEGGEHRPPEHLIRQDSERSQATSGSHYDDADSNISPDYASTRKSSETQESVERPRAGVLRTVGDPSAAQPPAQNANDSGFDLPNIDFGRSVIPARTQSPMRAPTPGGITPTINEPRTFPPGPSRSNPGPTQGYTHYRGESNETARQVPWQPGGARVASPSPGERTLSPEEFVQQRAAAATATPLYAHGHNRSVSGNTLSALRTGTPTPPLRRNNSQELLAAHNSAPHSRSNSADLLQQRPSSQGTGAALASTSHLSAREQEHVARVTGSPLLNVGNRSNTPQAQQPGLVGAIEAREREKAQMKQGLGGQAVAAAIDQRQREQFNQAQRAAQVAYQQQQGGYNRAMSPGPGVPSPSMYAGSSMGPMGMGMGPGPVMSPPSRNNSFGPGIPPQQQQQRPQMPQQQLSYGQPNPYGQPSPQMYAPPQQGMPWAGPPQQRGPPPQQGMRVGSGSRPQSPAVGPPPQRQFSPVGQGGRPGTPGGGMPFQGQAF